MPPRRIHFFMNDDQFGDGLRDIVRESLGDATGNITSLRRLSGGASRSTWAFDFSAASPPSQTRRFVLQLHGDVLTESALPAPIEARLLRRAHEHGIPVPVIVADGEEGGPLGVAYFIMEMLEGEVLPRHVLRDPSFGRGLTFLNEQCASALARIHAMPTTGLELVDHDLVDEYRKALDDVAQPHPVLEWAYRWLQQHRPTPHRSTVVHGDFRLGNLMMNSEGLHAVLDWELAHVGDPYEDLAWPLVRAWRFDHWRPLGVFPERQQWLDAYAAVTNTVIDDEVVRWWEVATTFKWAVICLTQWNRHQQGTTRSVELALIGRRVAENEFDLLKLIP